MKLAVRLAVPVLAVVALAGCAPSSSTAAVVAGKTITRGQVDAAHETCKAVNPRMPELPVVQALTLRKVAFKEYEQIGAPVDEAELDKIVRQDPAVKQVEGTACWSVAQGFFRFNAMQTRLKPAQVTYSISPPVELNSRYGAFGLKDGWDPEGGSLQVLLEKQWPIGGSSRGVHGGGRDAVVSAHAGGQGLGWFEIPTVDVFKP